MIRKKEKNLFAIMLPTQHMQQQVNVPKSQSREAREYMHHNSTPHPSTRMKIYFSPVVQERMR